MYILGSIFAPERRLCVAYRWRTARADGAVFLQARLHIILRVLHMREQLRVEPPCLASTECAMTHTRPELVDQVLGNDDLIDVIFGFLPQKSSLIDRTMAASTCKRFAARRPNLRRERLVELASLTQKSERYFSMRQCTRRIVQTLLDDKSASGLSREERQLFADSFRQTSLAHREALHRLQLLEESECAKGTPSSLLGLVAAHRRQLFGKMQALAEELLELIDAALLPRARATRRHEPPTRAHRFARELEPFRQAGSHDDEVFYLKLRGDALRWLAETAHHATANAHGTAMCPWYDRTRRRGDAAGLRAYPRDAVAAYKEALALAKRHLPWDVTRLACVNNYAVLLVCVLGLREEGSQLVRDALEQLGKMHGVQDAAWTDRVAPLKELMRSNLSVWEEERERDREGRAARRAVDDSILQYPSYRGQGCSLTLRAWRRYGDVLRADEWVGGVV